METTRRSSVRFSKTSSAPFPKRKIQLQTLGFEHTADDLYEARHKRNETFLMIPKTISDIDTNDY